MVWSMDMLNVKMALISSNVVSDIGRRNQTDWTYKGGVVGR